MTLFPKFLENFRKLDENHQAELGQGSSASELRRKLDGENDEVIKGVNRSPVKSERVRSASELKRKLDGENDEVIKGVNRSPVKSERVSSPTVSNLLEFEPYFDSAKFKAFAIFCFVITPTPILVYVTNMNIPYDTN